jgi:hypothetical protein
MEHSFAEIRDNREGPDRDFRQVAAFILGAGAEPLNCMVVDLSEGGAKLLVHANQQLPNVFKLLIPNDQVLNEPHDCEVRWRKNERLGVKFCP